MAAMSYNVTVTVRNGTATAVAAGPAPDGQLVIIGHEDPTTRTLGVTYTPADGQGGMSASAMAVKES